MPRFVPPMYGKVRRKKPPTPTRQIGTPTTPAPAPAPQKAEAKATPEEAAPKKSTKKAAPKKSTKKAAPKKSTKKKGPKRIEWDESMTQKELYRLAKDAGLEVRSKDWKDEIMDALKKHNRKAAK